MAALPFCHFTLTASKPNGLGYPGEPKTLGDHLRKRRMDLGLPQKVAAQRMGGCVATITNWERNRTQPELRHLPKIIAFLGYDPLPSPTTLAERLLHFRQVRGLTQYQLARIIQVDPTTVARWERGERQPLAESRKQVEAILARG